MPTSRTSSASTEIEERAKIAAIVAALDRAAPMERPAADVPATLEKDGIRPAMQSVMPRLKACYEEALNSGPSLKGSVVMSMEIGAQDGKGSVLTAEVLDEKSTAKNLFLQACALEAAVNAPFDAPRGNGVVRVTYPFRFTSSADPEAP